MLRYQTAQSGDDHVFFSGASTTTSTELMRIKGTGNVGIGVSDPSQSLDVSGTARLRNIPTNATNNLILTVDANGVVAKQNAQAAQLPVITGVLGAGTTLTTAATWINTGASITLPANSKYVVTVNMLLNGTTPALPDNSSLWIRSTFSDSPTTISGSDIIGSSLASGILVDNATFSMLTGSILLRNSTSAPKKYYYFGYAAPNSLTTAGATYTTSFANNASENQIYAIPIN
ncbi:hypothetical protein GCM10028816_50710 [Spirosoma lituiforme]